MSESNTARIIFLIGGIIVLGIVITGLSQHWDDLKQLIDNFFKHKMIRMWGNIYGEFSRRSRKQA